MHYKRIIQVILAALSFIVVTFLILFFDAVIEFWPLYFIPVLLAIFSYGLWGGIVSAVAVDIMTFILAYLKYSVGELATANFIAITVGLGIILLVGIVFGYFEKSRLSGEFGTDKLALVDRLTGLYNYNYFRDRLEEEKERSDRFGSKVSVALVNIDYFKSFNDKFGYSKGNQLLKKLAQVCKEQVRAVDILVRYGGGEFAVIMPNTGPQGANEVAERLRSAIEETEFEGTEKKPKTKRTVSIGVVTYPDHARSVNELTDSLSSAVLAAKNAGRNRVYVYEVEK